MEEFRSRGARWSPRFPGQAHSRQWEAGNTAARFSVVLSALIWEGCFHPAGASRLHWGAFKCCLLCNDGGN